ncbi:MAG: hypothetical protein GEU88_19400 [Solirubrobacterales bacterium]|nr:hypothetical protein [Solirubrobacterales bacterium]
MRSPMGTGPGGGTVTATLPAYDAPSDEPAMLPSRAVPVACLAVRITAKVDYAVRALVELAAVAPALVRARLVDEGVARELAGRGIPAIAGLRTALACARALRAKAGDPKRLREIAATAESAASSTDAVGAWLGEARAKAILREAGIAVPEGGQADELDDCLAIAAEIGWPVALKLSGPGVRHKSDVGAIALGLDDEEQLRTAHARLAGSSLAAGASMLVERMVAAGVELLVAARRDAVVPALVVGLGGIWTEALDDVAIVPLPASPARVETALRSLRGAALLAGGRGGEGVDLAALAALGARAGELLLERDLDLLELNPVVATAAGAVAVDAVARRRRRRVPGRG